MKKKIFIITILLSIFSIRNSYNMQIIEKEEDKTEETKISQPEKIKIKMKKQKAYLKAKEFYGMREYEKAFLYFEHAANKECLEAQLDLALMLTEGVGCEKNLEEALKLTNIVRKTSIFYSQKKKNREKYFLDISYSAIGLWHDIITKILSEPREIKLDLSELEPLQQILQKLQGEDEEKEEEDNSTTPYGMYM